MKSINIFILLVSILIVLQFFDLQSSLINIQKKRDAFEANPAMKFILNNFGLTAYSLVKLLLVPSIFLVIILVLRPEPKSFKPWFNVVVFLIVLIYLYAVIWNYTSA